MMEMKEINKNERGGVVRLVQIGRMDDHSTDEDEDIDIDKGGDNTVITSPTPRHSNPRPGKLGNSFEYFCSQNSLICDG